MQCLEHRRILRAASCLASYAGQPPRGTARRSLPDGKGWFSETRQRGELACLICGAAAARNCQTRFDEWETLVFWDQAASDTEGAPGLNGVAMGHEASCALPRCVAPGVRFARGFRGRAGARPMWSERRYRLMTERIWPF